MSWGFIPAVYMSLVGGKLYFSVKIPIPVIVGLDGCIIVIFVSLYDMLSSLHTLLGDKLGIQ